MREGAGGVIGPGGVSEGGELGAGGGVDGGEDGGLIEGAVGVAALGIDVSAEDGHGLENEGDFDFILDEFEIFAEEGGDGGVFTADLEGAGGDVGVIIVRVAFFEIDDGFFGGGVCGGGEPEIAVDADGIFKLARAEPGESEEDDDGEEAGGEDDGAAGALLFVGVVGAGDEAFFTEDFFNEEIAEEVGAITTPDLAFGEGVDGDAEDFGEFGVEGGAFGHGAGEVDAAEEEGLGGPFAGLEDHFEIAAEARADLDDGVGQGVESIDLIDPAALDVFGVDGIEEELLAAFGEAIFDGFEMVDDGVGVEAFIQRRGVGPAHDLVLELGIVEVVEEFAEAVEEIALGDDDEDGEADAEEALDLVELLSDFGGFFLDGIGGVLDEGIDGDDEEDAADGAVGAIVFKELEELVPFVGGAGGDFFEHETAGGIENDGLVGEPPVHVEGAARTLELVLKAGGEADVAMADSFGFSGAGLADEDVPRDGVEVFSGGAEFFDALFEIAAEIVEARTASGFGNALRGGGGVSGDAHGEGIGFSFAHQLEDEAVEEHEAEDDDEADGEDEDGGFIAGEEHIADADDGAAAHEAKAGFRGAGEGAEFIESGVKA